MRKLQNGRDGVPREFIAPSIVGLDRDGRATSRLAARFLRGFGHSKRIHLSELSFRTIEGACSRLFPYDAQIGERLDLGGAGLRSLMFRSVGALESLS